MTEESSQPKETENQPRVTIWRAITGSILHKGEYSKRGVSDQDLKNGGIFVSNDSISQREDAPYDRFGGVSDVSTSFRRVDGLPVFLSQEEAKNWIGNSSFQNPPALVSLEIPMTQLVDENSSFKLVKNTLSPTGEGDEPLDRQKLEKHLSGEERIQGELYLKSADGKLIQRELMKPYEKIYRPQLLPSGQIDQEKGFVEVILD